MEKVIATQRELIKQLQEMLFEHRVAAASLKPERIIRLPDAHAERLGRNWTYDDGEEPLWFRTKLQDAITVLSARYELDERRAQPEPL